MCYKNILKEFIKRVGAVRRGEERGEEVERKRVNRKGKEGLLGGNGRRECVVRIY